MAVTHFESLPGFFPRHPTFDPHPSTLNTAYLKPDTRNPAPQSDTWFRVSDNSSLNPHLSTLDPPSNITN